MTANILPNAKSQFIDEAGAPLAAGFVYMYVPNSSTFKTTWQDSAQSIQNTNPIILDAAGQAIIFGSGAYRQLVADSLGNTIWDAITIDPGYAIITSFTGTSTTSLLIGTGTKTLTTQAGLAFFAGGFLQIASNADATNYMNGTVTSYDSVTGILVMNITNTGGSGTFADWNISVSGTRGATGSVGITGAPVSGFLAKWSGTNTITNGDLSGDVTTTSTLVSTISKIQGTTVLGTTGTSNVVFSNSPTLTGTTTAGIINSIGAVTAKGFIVTGTTVVSNGAYLVSSNTIGISANTGLVATFTTTGLNNTVIGATTPLAATVTSLTGSGIITFSTGANPVSFLATSGGFSVNQLVSGNISLTTSGGNVVLSSGTLGTIDNMTIGGSAAADGTFANLNVSAATTFNDNATFASANKGIILKRGANGRVGTFVLTGTTAVTVNNTSVATSDIVSISLAVVGGTVGTFPTLKTITAASGFTVAGAVGDTSTYNYMLTKSLI